MQRGSMPCTYFGFFTLHCILGLGSSPPAPRLSTSPCVSHDCGCGPLLRVGNHFVGKVSIHQQLLQLLIIAELPQEVSRPRIQEVL